MHPCMNSSTWHKPRLSDINIRSVITIQVTDLSGKAAVKMQPLISPSSSPRRSCRHVPGWPPDHETSEDVDDERDMISTIGARLSTRLDELYTAHAVGSRGSQRREQQVVDRKPTHTRAPAPYVHVRGDRRAGQSPRQSPVSSVNPHEPWWVVSEATGVGWKAAQYLLGTIGTAQWLEIGSGCVSAVGTW